MLLRVLPVGVFLCFFTAPGRAEEAGVFGQPARTRVVFTQAPVGGLPADSADRPSLSGQGFLPPLRNIPKSRIALLDLERSDESPRLLTPEFESACSPVVSFDGRRVAFAGRKNAGDSWNIWEMDVDGGNKRRIIAVAANCLTPEYLPSIYTLDDLTPRDQVVFASDAAGAANELSEGAAWSLYTCELTGENVRRITFNLSADFDPTVLPDGRILFSSWQRYGARYFPTGLFALLAVNTDGTDLLPFYGNHGLPVLKCQPAVSEEGWVYFVESNGRDPLGGGNVAAVNLRRNLESYTPVAADDGGFYLSPSPFADGKLIVSFRKKGETYGVYELAWHGQDAHASSQAGIPAHTPDEGSTFTRKLFDDPEWHDVEARLVAPRPRPKGRSSVVNYEFDTSDIFCMDCYISDRPEVKNAPAGSLRRLRVIEGIPLRYDAPGWRLPENEKRLVPGASVYSATAFGPRRILGDVPVESDGSFYFRAPAETPIAFQVLDENGMVVATHQSWMWGMPKENRGCIGCHEDRELTPPNRLTEALKKPPFQLIDPPEKRRTVDFTHDIAPLIRGRCVQCHTREHPRLDLSSLENPGSDESDKSGAVSFSGAYKLLLCPSETGTEMGQAGSPSHRYVMPGSARESPMVWHLFGKRMGGTGNSSAGGISAAQMPPEVPLSDAERRLFIEWIDLGAQWNNRAAPEDAAPKLSLPKKSSSAPQNKGGM